MTTYAKYSRQLKPTFRRLKLAKPIRVTEYGRFPIEGGCYVFIEDKKHIYVGITKNIRRRMRNHTSKQSVFALKLAREVTQKKRTYRSEGSLNRLLEDPAFLRAFESSRERIREMKAKYVTIEDVSLRYLFEFYAAVTMRSAYNDFETH